MLGFHYSKYFDATIQPVSQPVNQISPNVQTLDVISQIFLCIHCFRFLIRILVQQISIVLSSKRSDFHNSRMDVIWMPRANLINKNEFQSDSMKMNEVCVLLFFTHMKSLPLKNQFTLQTETRIKSFWLIHLDLTLIPTQYYLASVCTRPYACACIQRMMFNANDTLL